jgi:hypothetical protein
MTVATLSAVALLAGCGGSSGESGDREAKEKAEKQLAASGAPTPVCVEQAKAKAARVPASFPSDFPLPGDAVIYATEQRSGGRTIVYAVVDDDVKAVLKQLQTDLPKAGFTLTEGEVEEHDAESNWTGNGYSGRWAIRSVADCTDQTSVTVLAAKG